MLTDVIVVTYHSHHSAARELQNFLRLAAASRPTVSWSFVDNSEDSSDAAFLEVALRGVGQARVLRRSDNPGFAAACNEAAKTSQAEWVLLINPDISLDEKLLDQIVDCLGSLSSDISCVAISQQTGSLTHQGIAFNRAGWFMDRPVKGAVGEGGGRARLYRSVGGAGRLFGPSGGAAAIRREVFLAMGGFYEPLFAWGEDADLALRLHLRGHGCAALDLALPHLGGHSVTSGTVSRRRARLLVRNRVMIAARLYDVPQALSFGAFLAAVLIAKTPRMIRQRTLGAHLAGVVQGCVGIRSARASYLGPRLGLSWPR